MTYEEAKKMLKGHCKGCIHPQQMEWCKSHCEIGIAIEALEKQMPKKVEWTLDYTWGVEREVPVCPACDYYLTPIEFIDANICEQTGHCEFLKISYCEHCSQAIDWSEVE